MNNPATPKVDKRVLGDPRFYLGDVQPMIEIRVWDGDDREWYPIRMTEEIHKAIKDHVTSELAFAKAHYSKGGAR